jgi:cellulose synthase/poly-beta-1,6-N-acetylglucosamine synthase-like glycosyltransferase
MNGLAFDLGTGLLFAYLFCMLVLFVFSMHNFIMIYYFLKHRKDRPTRKSEVLSRPASEWPMVTVQLPIFNETAVAERLVRATADLDWPRERLEIQVLDDSTDETLDITRAAVERLTAEGYRARWYHRVDRKGYKAGALREALSDAHGDFVAIFDADFVPDRNFLRETIPYFEASRIGMVQTRWGHLNEDYSLLTQAQAIGLNGHFVIQQLARSRAGFFINFNGTGGVWRRTCILDAGNWQDDTLTEDLDLSYRAQLKGWRFVYLNHVVSPGELPVEINALKSQQFRWTKGSIETAKKLVPKILRSELALWPKIQALFHLTGNFSYVFVLLSCLLNSAVLFLHNENGRFNIILDTMTFFFLTIVGLFIFYLYSEKTINPNWKKRMLLFPVFMMGSIGLSISNSKAVLEGFFNIKSAFVRTPKWGVLKRSERWSVAGGLSDIRIDKIVFLEMLMIVYALSASAVGIHNYMTEKSNFIGMIFFNLWTLVGFSMIVFLTFKHELEARN